jgi:hypothetical protein
MEKAVELDVGVPVWSHAGMICTGETYKNVVKMTFAPRAPRSRTLLVRPRLGSPFVFVLIGVPGGMLWRPSRVSM